MAIVDIAIEEISKTRRRLIRQCKSEDDILSVGAALMSDAQTVFTQMGGRNHAAAQFYAIADRLAAPEKGKPKDVR